MISLAFYFLTYHRGLKVYRSPQSLVAHIFLRVLNDKISFVLINFTYIIKLWRLHRRTPYQMSPYHANTPIILTTVKRGEHVQNMFRWFIYLMYMYIRVCSYLDFVISKILDQYMICPGLKKKLHSTPGDFSKS